MIRYLLFGRKEYAEPLTYLDVLEAVNQDAATIRAREQYDTSWLELSLVPEADVHWILRPSESKQRLIAKLPS
jgi:hypothetical protein